MSDVEDVIRAKVVEDMHAKMEAEIMAPWWEKALERIIKDLEDGNTVTASFSLGRLAERLKAKDEPEDTDTNLVNLGLRVTDLGHRVGAYWSKLSEWRDTVREHGKRLHELDKGAGVEVMSAVLTMQETVDGLEDRVRALDGGGKPEKWEDDE